MTHSTASTALASTVRLRAMDREALAAHFIALDAEDRRLRFGSGISDAGIRDYVRRLEFARDGLFGVHAEDLSLLAVVHVATGEGPAELGLSVAPGWRNHGLGNALFRRAMTFLRNREVRQVFVHCLSENAAMMHLARKHGMRIVPAGGETDAHLALDPPTADSFISEWLEDQRGQALRTLRQGTRNARAFFGVA